MKVFNRLGCRRFLCTIPKPIQQDYEVDRWRRIKEMVESGVMDEEMYSRQARKVDNSILTDQFNRLHTYLRISLTERCNLRCRYCMPEEGIQLTQSSHLMNNFELERISKLFVHAGINKIRLTGGEPTLRKDVVDIVHMLGEIDGLEQIAMTSNGIILHRMLPQLRAAGLSHLNISLDTLKPERFERMTRRKGFKHVMKSIDKAIEEGFSPLKLNFVVMKGENNDEVLDFVELTRDRPINVRFIEWMPFDGNVWSHEKMEPYKVTRQNIENKYGPLRPVFNEKNAVAKDFTVEGFMGEVSFVTSMTEHFCGSCNRLRLMADGNFKVCLFGAEEANLLKGLRGGYSDEELANTIYNAVQRKKAKHAGMFELSKLPNRSMVRIGG